ALALIARASEGSVRDGLSILDQALAISDGTINAGAVRDMLGLADRGRIFDLLETLLAGDAGAALTAFADLTRDGADPVRVLADLAEAAHTLTRARIAGAGAAGDTLSAEEQSRAAALAEKLSIPALSRAWQILVKGYEDAGRAPDAFAAAEMVLIRMAYTATLPTPDDLVRGARDGVTSSSETAGKDAPTGDASSAIEHPQASNDAGPVLATFKDIVAYVGSHRDVALKLELEEKIRPVSVAPGRIEIELVPGARSALAGDLKRKLDAWTAMTWTIIVAREGGGATIDEQKKAHEKAEREHVADAPLLKQALAAFPGAEITSIEPLDEHDGEPVSVAPDETAKGT
ncbi:MAG: DNA polymerase III subunit gamma/tau, partial [Pseudomonadota bacterium]